MLDQLMTRSNAARVVFTAEYAPGQAVTNRKLINEGGRNLHVLFPPWHGGGRFLESLANRLARNGDAVLAYYLHDEILKPNTETVRASYAHLRDVIAAELASLTESHDYAKVHLAGMSLGNAALSTVIGEFHDFDSVSLVCSASSLARSMWHGTRTQHVRAGIEGAGQDLADVEEAWQDLAPINHLDDLIGKDVSLLVSTSDAIIPSRHQMELVDAAVAQGLEPHVQTTRLGHYAAIGKYCIYDPV